MSFREHGVLLYLDPTLYKGFIKLQADKGLGRSYAGLLSFTEGLFHLGYLAKEDYESHIRKYSEALKEGPKRQSKEELEKETKFKKIELVLTQAFQQWDNLNEEARAFHIKTARVNAELEIAQKILEKGS